MSKKKIAVGDMVKVINPTSLAVRFKGKVGKVIVRGINLIKVQFPNESYIFTIDEVEKVSRNQKD